MSRWVQPDARARGKLLAVLALAAALAAASAPAAPADKVPRLAHIVVIVFENHERDEVLGTGEAPTFDRLATRYADLTSYYAVTHPSLPNYLALVSGSTQGISDDCTACSAHGPSVGTLLTRAHRSWGGYAEGYPNSPRFAKKHMPFLYFAGQASHVHPLAGLDRSRLPAFALVAPDLCNDAHDCGINPKPNEVYRQEYYAPGGARDQGRVLGLGVSVSYRTFTKSLATIEWSPVEPQFEEKYYVAGIGEVKEQVTLGGHERFELVSLTHG